MKALRFFLPRLGNVHRSALAALSLSLVTLAAGIALLGVSGWFLTAAALATTGALFNLFAPSAAVRGLSFVRILARYGERLAGHSTTLRLLAELRQWLFATLFPIAPAGRSFGRADIASRLIADIDALDAVPLLALGPITTALLAGVAMSAALAVLLPAAAWVYAGAVLVAVVALPIALLVGSRRAGAAALEAASDLRRRSLDAIDGHQDLVVLGALGRASSEAAEAAARLAAARRRLAGLAASAAGVTQLLAAIAVLGTLVAGLESHAAGQLEGPLLVGIVLAVAASFEASALLVRSTTRLATAGAAAERLLALAGLPPAVAEPFQPVAIPPGGALAFERVGFGYEPSRPVLRELNFVVRTGERVAVTGASGSGKSTIAQLMTRLVDPQAGRVTLNGIDLRAVAPAELRRRVALMTQDAPAFNDTVRNNLHIGNVSASDAALWNALETVSLADAVRALPGGLDAIVGEAGRTLSAGQARRLCLARSILSPADVLILDEPTNGLDAEAEAVFLADLSRIAAGRTMIVITHAALPRDGFDRVLHIRAGRLEMGQGDLLGAE